MKRPDLAAVISLLVLAGLFFAPVLSGRASLVPFDNLFRFPPWKEQATRVGAGQPHNELLDDLVLENYPWKTFLAGSYQKGEIPLWNPYLFGGTPFLAAGQNQGWYPFSLLFLILPVAQAFGWFAALQIALAGILMYAYLRTLCLGRLGALAGGITFQLSGFMVVSVVFPMVISAAAWLPAILMGIEKIVRSAQNESQDKRDSRVVQIGWGILTAFFIGMQFLAGHVEISYYILLVSALYTLWRLTTVLRQTPPLPTPLLARTTAMIAASAALGTALAGVQLLPLLELVAGNFRAGSASYDQVIGYAYPLRQLVTFLIPDFFGNPAHHNYLDLFDLSLRPAPSGTIFWGAKNFVEAGAYLGILPLAAGILGVGAGLGRKVGRSRPAEPALFFAALVGLSLLFAFGTPLYAVLFYGLPGWNQLHTPFRWVFPFTLAASALAGIGIDRLARGEFIGSRLLPVLGRGLFGVGIGLLGVLGAAVLLPGLGIGLGERLLAASELARGTFSDGRMFFSYEARPFFLLATWLVGAGAVLQLARLEQRRLAGEGRGERWWRGLALVIIALDLASAWAHFNPESDPSLAQVTPPAIQFLMQDRSLFRVTSLDRPGEKILNPNAGMIYGLEDIRGYDSIIPKQYTDYMALIASQGELVYNRVAPLYDARALASPLLNLMNVKYVLTTQEVTTPGYRLVYDAEVKIYENRNALPRAFLAAEGEELKDPAELGTALARIDPAERVLLEGQGGIPALAAPQSRVSMPPPRIESHSSGEVVISTAAPEASWLVLTDSYFPGWTAEVDGKRTTIYRADGNWRSVLAPAGSHQIWFKYSPLSFRLGALVSFVAAILAAVGLGAVGWHRLNRREAEYEEEQVRIVARNSIVPTVTSFLNKGIDFVFAAFMLRVLGPTGAGQYFFAVAVWLNLNTVTDFGLGILITREVARDRTRANRFLVNSAALRLALTLLSSLPLAGLVALYSNWLPQETALNGETTLAIWLLALSLIPGNLAGALSGLFYAFELFEFPALVTVITRLFSLCLGIAVLLFGWGIVGLAAASVITNLVTFVVLFGLTRRKLFRPHWEPDPGLIRWMFFESYPLMLNNLLANLFFRIDAFILKPLQGDTVLGFYSTAYKFVDAMNFIPANFTLAIFPLLSRYATSRREALQRAYLVSLRLLLWMSLPITVGTVFAARELVLFFGGPAYLPDSQVALQWLVWFLPFSFVNSVTHYVLIAVGQQRFLTRAFLVGLAFNIAANLIAIPLLSYRGAALVTVLSEVALLIPFYIGLRREAFRVPFLDLVWRPVLATAAMALVCALLIERAGLVLGLCTGGAVYLVLLVGLGSVGAEERLVLRRLLRRPAAAA